MVESVVQYIHPDVRGKTHQLLVGGKVGKSESLGPKGTLHCLCRVPFIIMPGQIEYYENRHPNDRIDVSNQMLSRLHFRVTDILGNNKVDRGNISFSFPLNDFQNK